MTEKQLAEFFVEQRVLQPSQADDVLSEVELNGKSVAQAMIDGGFIDEPSFYETIANGLGTEFVNLSEREIAPEILRFVPSGLARLHGALPIDMSETALRVALVDPFDVQIAEDLRFALGKDIQVVVSPPEQIEELIKQYYGTDTTSMEEVLKQLGEAGEALQLRETDGEAAVEAEANATPIIRFVDLILYQAIQDRASDIHFEPFENEFKIRYRVDGALYEMSPPPRHLALPVISRVKVMANMNIAERRLPQDGRIQKQIAGRSVDLRVSTLPTQFGESLVLRVLDRSIVNLDLQALGMPDYIYNFLLEMIERPNGIFIATGPTGSGKTTTLVLLFAQDQHNRFEADHGRGTSRIRFGRYRSGTGERSDRLNLCTGVAALPASGPRSYYGWRDARSRDGANCHSSVAHRASGLYDTAHERCAGCDYAFDRHGCGALPYFVNVGSRPGSAALAQHLWSLPRAVPAE